MRPLQSPESRNGKAKLSFRVTWMTCPVKIMRPADPLTRRPARAPHFQLRMSLFGDKKRGEIEYMGAALISNRTSSSEMRSSLPLLVLACVLLGALLVEGVALDMRDSLHTDKGEFDLEKERKRKEKERKWRERGN